MSNKVSFFLTKVILNRPLNAQTKFTSRSIFKQNKDGKLFSTEDVCYGSFLACYVLKLSLTYSPRGKHDYALKLLN